MDTLCNDLLDKAEQIQVNLNIKFTKNTQLAHYGQMEKVYDDMEELEQKMNDIYLCVMDRKWKEEKEANNIVERPKVDRGHTGNLFGDGQYGT